MWKKKVKTTETEKWRSCKSHKPEKRETRKFTEGEKIREKWQITRMSKTDPQKSYASHVGKEKRRFIGIAFRDTFVVLHTQKKSLKSNDVFAIT